MGLARYVRRTEHADDDGRHAEVCQTGLCTCMTLALSRKGSPINTSLSSAGLICKSLTLGPAQQHTSDLNAVDWLEFEGTDPDIRNKRYFSRVWPGDDSPYKQSPQIHGTNVVGG